MSVNVDLKVVVNEGNMVTLRVLEQDQSYSVNGLLRSGVWSVMVFGKALNPTVVCEVEKWFAAAHRGIPVKVSFEPRAGVDDKRRTASLRLLARIAAI